MLLNSLYNSAGGRSAHRLGWHKSLRAFESVAFVYEFGVELVADHIFQIGLWLSGKLIGRQHVRGGKQRGIAEPSNFARAPSA